MVETNARCLIEAVRQIPEPRHICLEEGTLSEWLYEVLSPHAQRVVVAAVSESRGAKDDRRDAFGLADDLRLGAIKRKVYKERGRFGALGCRAKGYRWARGDGVRVKNRLKSLYRSRGVDVAGSAVYTVSQRGDFLRRLPTPAQPLAELLYEEMDALTRSSSDWVRTRTGEWVKAEVKWTRGLNRNFNHTLKAIFQGAATTVIGRKEDEPIYRHYLRLLDGGTKPNLAKLTIALEVYDPTRLERASNSG